MANCKDCEDEIVWADLDGKNVPFDEEYIPHNPDFNLWKGLYVITNGKAQLATEEDVQLRQGLFSCHFDTCRERSI